jgi:HSP20 family protein
MNCLTTRTHDIPSLFNDVFFKDFFGDGFFSSLPTLKKIDYPIDIHETKEGLILDIAAIGLDKSDVKIDIKDDVLSLSHKKEEKNENDNYAYRGITQKSFNFAWRINDKFDLTKTTAVLEKGLLKITIPLAPEKKPKEIQIQIN